MYVMQYPGMDDDELILSNPIQAGIDVWMGRFIIYALVTPRKHMRI